MINAGASILPFTGTQSFNSTTQEWEGIDVSVNYPADQNQSANPIEVGDFLVETAGLIWEVKNAQYIDNTTFRLSLLLTSGTPSSNTSPSLGLVERAAICTPINGLVVPYWDPTKVGSTAIQIANLHNAEKVNTPEQYNTAFDAEINA